MLKETHDLVIRHDAMLRNGIQKRIDELWEEIDKVRKERRGNMSVGVAVTAAIIALGTMIVEIVSRVP